jgi:hypothetical protein
LNAELSLLMDYAEALAKRQGHETIELRHLACALQRMRPEQFTEAFGPEAAGSVGSLLLPQGIYFGPLKRSPDVDAALAGAEAGGISDLIPALRAAVGAAIQVETATADGTGATLDAAHTTAALAPTQHDLGELLDDLHSLIGLDAVKAQIEELCQLQRVTRIREERGMRHIEMSRHLVFTGNPGTGKTTVARLVSRMYAALGLVSRGGFVEVSRADLVAGYVGQTSIKTAQVVQRALGGVLFIDEAYSLTRFGGDFGEEAIAELILQMENHRDDLAVIVAGYPELMARFIASNPGLSSRFGHTIAFPDYNASELWEIFERMCVDNGYVVDPQVAVPLTRVLSSLPRTDSFGNARVVRNMFEHILGSQAMRLTAIPEPSDDELATLTVDDCMSILQDMDQRPSPPTGQYL